MRKLSHDQGALSRKVLNGRKEHGADGITVVRLCNKPQCADIFERIALKQG